MRQLFSRRTFRKFYEQKVIKERSKQFDLDEKELRQPFRRIVARFGNYCFDRAIVISGRITKKKSVKVFFYDYGTVAHMHVSSCKLLIENYEDIPPLAHRAALHGIEPSPESGIKLWPAVASSDLAAKVLDKEVKIKIMKRHDKYDFYEVKVELDSQDLSELLIEEGVAIASHNRDIFNDEIVVNCIKYPPFEFIENTDFYPTSDERNFLIREECIDFNEFEEDVVDMSICDIVSVKAQKRELKKAFKDGFAKGDYSEVEAGINLLLEGYHSSLHLGGDSNSVIL